VEIMNAEIYRSLTRKFDKAGNDDIYDAMSTSALVILERSPLLEPIQNQDAFRVVVARRELIRRHKKLDPLLFPDGDAVNTWEKVAIATHSYVEAHTTENKSDVARVLESIPERYSEVLRMHYLEGMTMEEIAVKLNLKSHCIRKRHERALKVAKKVFSSSGTILVYPKVKRSTSNKQKQKKRDE